VCSSDLADQRRAGGQDQERQHLKRIFGTDNEEALNAVVEYLEQRPQKRRQPTEAEKNQHTEAQTKKALRHISPTTISERIQQLRKLVGKQKYKNRQDLKAKIERLNLWTRQHIKEKQTNRRATAQEEEGEEEIKKILNSTIFANWKKEEQYRYTTFETETQGETTTIRNLADIGLNMRLWTIPTELYEKAKKRKATVKEIVEAITENKRNDLPNHYLLEYLNFGWWDIRRYIKKDGREIVDNQQTPVYVVCGIRTHYAIRPRTAAEHKRYRKKDKKTGDMKPTPIPPQIIDRRTGRPLQDFIAQVLSRIHRTPRHTGRRETDSLSDVENYAYE
jgi:hypothetical protein